MFQYAADGADTGSFNVDAEFADVRGATSNAAGSFLWLIDGPSHQVAVYGANGKFEGSWQADGLIEPQGIATDGTDIWIVDAALGQVLRFADAATWTAGLAGATDWFDVAQENTSPSGLATDGSTIWVSDDVADQVFVYSTDGTSAGQWFLDSENADPSGITNNPAGGTDLWVVDRTDLAVYHYPTGGVKDSGYDGDATDADRDALSYSLISGPADGMIDTETGEITWNPSIDQVGTYAVALRVQDLRGGFDEQHYTLSVIEPPPNRPPVITSTPVVDASVGAVYQYDAEAKDADGDSLTFSLDDAPSEVSIDPGSGMVSWTPSGSQFGSHQLSLTVSDGRGGVATQEFTVIVLAESGNAPPVITSTPITSFDIPGTSNPPSGVVDPTAISVDLGLGETVAQTVSLNVPEPDPEHSYADVVFVVDESGSMAGEHAWIQEVVEELDTGLEARGIGSNRYGVVGFGKPIARSIQSLFRTSRTLTSMMTRAAAIR